MRPCRIFQKSFLWDLQLITFNSAIKWLIINNLLHLYSAVLDTQSALHSKRGICSSTTNVQHPPEWCDGSHVTPERPPHTSLLVERRQSDESNQCMGWLEGHNGQRPMGEFGQDAGVTPLLFFEGHPGIFNYLFLQSHPKDGALFLLYSFPITILGPTQTAGLAPPAGLNTTSSSSNLVFPGGLPSRYWPGSTLISFSGQPILGCRVIWLLAKFI